MNKILLIIFIFASVVGIICGVLFFDYRLEKRNNNLKDSSNNLNNATESLNNLISNTTIETITQEDIDLINYWTNIISNNTKVIIEDTQPHRGGGGGSSGAGGY
jgi:nanoRNase/pAp phosphatase (c-di-AMP/oligoRNAs hydrolase)